MISLLIVGDSPYLGLIIILLIEYKKVTKGILVTQKESEIKSRIKEYT